jgi:hypothetical protein
MAHVIHPAMHHLAERVCDPRWLVPRLCISDRFGRRKRVGDIIRPEQQEALDAFCEHKRILVLKPRQVGISTIVCVYIAARVYAATDAFTALSCAHEDGAKLRMHQMSQYALESLPPGFLRPDPLFSQNNEYLLRLAHNAAQHRQMVAGGRGQGRSESFQLLHFTEMAFYPQGSAATGKGDTTNDEMVWASTTSTLHDDPERVHIGQIIIESTARGPRGKFYQLARQAQQPASGWKFLFFPWFFYPEYTRTPEPGLEADLDADERVLMQPRYAPDGTFVRPALGLPQIAWRRQKLRVDQVDPLEFRREYPETPEEPFLARQDTRWFDISRLNGLLGSLPAARLSGTQPQLAIYIQPEKGRRYFIGADASGGVGRDYAVACVLRDDLVQVARWSDQWVPPEEQALAWAKLSAMYNRAVVLAEYNKHGMYVVKRLAEMGVTQWTNAQNKPFTTTPKTKRMIYDHAQTVLNEGRCKLNDPVAVVEMMSITEKASGNIEADGDGHDDHADSYCLALWAARTSGRVTAVRTPPPKASEPRARVAAATVKPAAAPATVAPEVDLDEVAPKKLRALRRLGDE